MGFSIDASKYLHKYEAYRIPTDNTAFNAKNLSVVKGDGDSILVLTEESRRQLVKDRLDYGMAMKLEQDKVNAKQQQEALKKQAADEAKIMAVYRNMSKGDIVPDADEKKLIDYDPKLYQMAKMAQLLAQRTEAKKHESEWDQKKEEEYQAKQKELSEIGDGLRTEFNETFDCFVEAQSAAVVEVDAGKINISSIKSVYNMGGGLTGAVMDVNV